MFVFELCKKNMLAASKTPVTIPPVTGFSKVYSTFESAKLGGWRSLYIFWAGQSSQTRQWFYNNLMLFWQQLAPSDENAKSWTYDFPQRHHRPLRALFLAL